MERFLHSPTLERIEFLDERFYKIPAGTHNNSEDIYYPSVTTILGLYPKEKAFLEWVKSLGYNVDIVVERAKESGSKVHQAVNSLVNGNQVSLMENGTLLYSIEEWSQICKVFDFFSTHNPLILASEVTLVCHTKQIAGTLDLVLELKGKRYLVDIKTSKNLYKENELQLAAYAYLWNKNNPQISIDHTAILWTKAFTKGPDKTGRNIQGEGWQLKVFERHYSEALSIFDHMHAIWKEENPNPQPILLSYPTVLKLN